METVVVNYRTIRSLTVAALFDSTHRMMRQRAPKRSPSLGAHLVIVPTNLSCMAT